MKGQAGKRHIIIQKQVSYRVEQTFRKLSAFLNNKEPES